MICSGAAFDGPPEFLYADMAGGNAEGEGEEKSTGNVFRAGAVSGQEEVFLPVRGGVGQQASPASGIGGR